MSGDCNRDALACGNPCNVKAPANTAACETLSSQIENFTLDFFGEVFKTEVNGQVQWSLPCKLDVGLPLNFRGAGEPLGCYMLRMFEYGVVGDKGEPGLPGTDGCNGSTPYVQVLTGFSQPPVNSQFSLRVTKNPSFLSGMDVFIEGSGWYEVLAADGLGNATLVLRIPVVNPGGYVPIGTVILPSGKIGSAGIRGIPGIKGNLGNKGLKGDKGVQGIQGIPGPASSVTLALTQANVPTWTSNVGPQTFTQDGYEGGFTSSGFVNVVLFPGAIPCTLTLPLAGTYLVMARVGWGATPSGGGVAQSNPGMNDFRLRNLSTNTTVPQSLVRVYATGLMVTFVSTVSANNIIQMQAQAFIGPGVISVHYLRAFKIS